MFDGSFRNDKRNGHGQLAITDSQSGRKDEKYSGMFKDDMFHGSGVHVNKHGDVYEGDFVKGKREGIGKLKQTRPEETLQYLGDFKADLFHGRGQLDIEKSGEDQVVNACVSVKPTTHYNGTFKQGKMDGDGELYEGAIEITQVPTTGDDPDPSLQTFEAG